MEAESSFEQRAAVHRALGEPARLRIVDALAVSDRTPGELAALTGAGGNLLAFHLAVLEDARVIERRVSEGDRRRRYVRLRAGAPGRLLAPPPVGRVGAPLFVCTRNSARSQFAAALWSQRSGRPGASAGSHPAPAVHPLAVEVAATYALDLGGMRPRGYGAVTIQPDVVVSVCDRAREGGLPFDGPRLHWSVPDPVDGDRASFREAFADIAERVAHLAAA